MKSKITTLIKAAYHYYVLNNPIMSDTAYNKLYDEIQKWEEEHNIPEKERITESLNAGYFEGKQQHKMNHPIPMLSLNKGVKEVSQEVVITPKLDGVALELLYLQGNLYAKLTRGDGKVGGDVTKTPILDIPDFVKEWEDKGLVVVRGEVVADKWEGATHRNWVAGSLGLINLEEAIKRGLRFVAYFLYPTNFTFIEDLKELSAVGFTIPDYVLLKNTKGMITEDYNKFPEYSIPTDGVVVRYNLNSTFGEHTAKAYKNMWAVKFEDETALSEIETVEWSQSKNNVWTPVAIISPVVIDGTEINRVNLASLDYIADKDIAIGDTVLVRKSKGIIPEIVEVVDRPKGRVEINLIRCPSCSSKLVKEGIYLKCKNSACGIDKRITFFSQALNIKGLAEKRIAQLKLTSPLEIFSLTEKRLVSILGKVGETIYDEIQRVKEKATLFDIIVALNPPMIKKSLLELIFSEISELDDLGNRDLLMRIKGIGEARAVALSTWYLENKHIIEAFMLLGFNFKKQEKTITSKKIAVSGSYYKMTRAEFIEYVKTKGYTVVSSPSSKCELFVVGEKASLDKIEKAKSLGLEVVSYDDFLRRVKNDTN